MRNIVQEQHDSLGEEEHFVKSELEWLLHFYNERFDVVISVDCDSEELSWAVRIEVQEQGHYVTHHEYAPTTVPIIWNHCKKTGYCKLTLVETIKIIHRRLNSLCQIAEINEGEAVALYDKEFHSQEGIVIED
jgi:hypothetical protein